ncbi:hypothetical protein [Bradyrhizobium erythrophlei]|uniref:Uncharacterized protein n=1 Tax=Bradyrhizobium erythrophlei TaxID=1437360 RepID=A0A1M5PPD7_9BRAD|nr:hypothetical protein [Bradyrhizobium erythrophlei]SHH03598.1 hypothetical protein SAMN05443248_3453 [Bradyrhizobium erythrophlei]
MALEQRRQAVTDAYLALESSKKIMDSCVKAYEAMLLHGSADDIIRYRAAVMSACEAYIDRIDQLIWTQMELDGIDPISRKLR